MTAARWVLPALLLAGGCTIDAFPRRVAQADGGAVGCGDAGIVDLFTNRNHCGACGFVCGSLPHVTASVGCAGGRCSLAGACEPGWLNCDGASENGCEADAREPAHCGRCGVVCRDATPACRAFAATPGDDGGAATDAAGVPIDDVTFANDGGAGLAFRCANNCTTGRVRCDDPPTCVDLQTDSRACGACGTACVPRANATTACVAGACAPACLPGFRDCNGDLAMATSDGCEVNTNTSTTSCGACGTACAAGQNRFARCLDGVCAPGDCMAGFGDCDADPANGCETALATSAAHCGRCGNGCAITGAGAACAAGMCTIAACNPGFGDCDAVPSNGCEVDTRTSAAHCGMCGRSCAPTPNRQAACVAGACAPGECAAGFADCDGDLANGCETVLAASTQHCGRCGNRCEFANAAATCAANTCVIGACSAGFGNCDGVSANGCEVNTRTNVDHCGTCANACPTRPSSSRACVDGACRIDCNLRRGNCDRDDRNGCEADLENDRFNCTACGMVCMFCGAGVCI